LQSWPWKIPAAGEKLGPKTRQESTNQTALTE